jgi:hypothetical protein
MDTLNRLIVFALFCVCAQAAFGHGSAQTSVRLNVDTTGAEVRVELTMPDLMKMVGGGLSAQIESAPEDLRDFALEYQGEVQKHIKLVDATNQILSPTSAWAQLPDFSAASVRNLGLEQQRIEVVLAYHFDRPPETLAVFFDLGQDHHGTPVYADCILRQQGEMTMLPAKLGPGFPLQFTFVWDEPIQPISELSDLQQASLGWRNRPVVSYLQADGERVTWTVMGPLSAWGEFAVDLSRMSDRQLAATLAERFVVRSADAPLERVAVHAARFPLNTFDYRMGRHVPRGQPDTTLLRLDMSFAADAEAEWLEAACLKFPDLSPRIFLSAWLAERAELFEVLQLEANSLRWAVTHAKQFSSHMSAPLEVDTNYLTN